MKLFETFLPAVAVIVGAAAVGLGGYIYSKAHAEKETKEECARCAKTAVSICVHDAGSAKLRGEAEDIAANPEGKADASIFSHEEADEIVENIDETIENEFEDAFSTIDECKDMEDGKKIAAAGVVSILAGVALFKATIKNKDIAYNSLLFDIYDWREQWANRARALSGLVNSLDRVMEGFGKEQEVSQLCQFDKLAVSLGEMRFRALSEMLTSYDELFKRRLKRAKYDTFTYVGLDLLDKYAYDEDYEI